MSQDGRDGDDERQDRPKAPLAMTQPLPHEVAPSAPESEPLSPALRAVHKAERGCPGRKTRSVAAAPPPGAEAAAGRAPDDAH
jgi:hypothetical protein